MIDMTFSKKHCRRKRSDNQSLFLFGVVSLLWFIFRTGTKPSRILYPCQRAALVNSLASLGLPISISMFAVTKRIKSLSKKAVIPILLALIVGVLINDKYFFGSFQLASADPDQEFQLKLQATNATESPVSDIYVVNGPAYAHIEELINLMGSHGLRFFRSNKVGANQGPEGLISNNDVVLIKINEQWSQRGGTNTDVLKELIQAIIDHPDDFNGEIVVADNGQGVGSMDWSQSNAEDTAQSTQDVVNMFSLSFNVSTYDWQTIRGTQVDEYIEGDMNSGYVLYNVTDPETGIHVSYPKFETDHGTYVSFKQGIWNGTAYEKRLKVINMPILKSHRVYGVTASTKHYMGVQSEGYSVSGGLANGHVSVATGGMGTLMVETGLPTLNILDAIYINANPWPSAIAGPSTYYFGATKVNLLMASVDPVALDYWASKHVLMRTAQLIGHYDTRTIDPDNMERIYGLAEAFGVWLNLTKNEIVTAGHYATNDADHMSIHVSQDNIPPTIEILSPENRTYPSPDVSLAYTASEPVDWVGYSLDGQANLTITGNTSLTTLPDGSHFVVVYANDTIGNMGRSGATYFSVDTLPPNITDITQSPLGNEVLPGIGVKINATVTDKTSGTDRVSLDYAYANSSGIWIRIIDMTRIEDNIWNATIPAFRYNTNVTYTVAAEDNVGNSITTEQMGYDYQYHVIPELTSFTMSILLIVTSLLTVLLHALKGGK